MPSLSRLLLGVMIVLSLATPGAARAQDSSQALARVRYLYRGLNVTPQHRATYRAHLKSPLYDQDRLQTGAQEKASIAFGDGTVLHLNALTDAIIHQHQTVVNGGEVAEYLQPGTDHQVVTPPATAGATGTTFDVQFGGNRAVFVVLHGALLVHNPQGSVLVTTGHESVVIQGAAPEPPQPVDAQAIFSWTDGIPTPDLGEDLSLDANGGTIQGVSSQRSGPNDVWDIEHIHDGLLSTGWESADGQPANQWVKVGFLGGNSYRVSGVVIDPAATGGDTPDADLKDFQIRVSNSDTNDTSFTTVFTGTCLQANSLQRFLFPVPVRARYVELVALDNYGNPDHVAVAELEVVATTSLFARPRAVAVDGHGNIYVADTNADRVQKLSPSGRVLAQWGERGTRPGQFQQPQGIAVDARGNVYVADTYNHRVQELSPHGNVLHVFGRYGLGAGEFDYPSGVAVDRAGNIYVVEFDTDRVDKLSPTGRVLAIWGGYSDSPILQFPSGIALDRQGNMYITDEKNRVVKLDRHGAVVATYAPAGTSDALNSPVGLAVDRHGAIYVADSFNARVEVLNPDGTVRATIGKVGVRPGEFLLPLGVAVDGAGNVYVADSGNGRIQKFSGSGRVRAVWGRSATIPQVLGQPGGIAVDRYGYIFVSDATNDRIQERDPAGHVAAVYGYHGFVSGQKGPGLGQMWWPHAVAVDNQGGIYVADTSNSRIQKLSQRGPVAAFGHFGREPGEMASPLGLALDPQGDIYVADSGNNRIQELAPDGHLLHAWGTGGSGPGQFNLPQGIAVTPTGIMYVADTENDRVQKLAPDGHVLAVWGAPFDINAQNRFLFPEDIALDAAGNVYVADAGNGAIQKLSPDGALLQTFTAPFGGPATARGVAVDGHGFVYMADDSGGRIIKFSPQGQILAIWR